MHHIRRSENKQSVKFKFTFRINKIRFTVTILMIFSSFQNTDCFCCRVCCSKQQASHKMGICWQASMISMGWLVRCTSSWSVCPTQIRNRVCQARALILDRLLRTSRLWDLRRTFGMPLTAWCRVFCGKLVVAHLVKKFPVIEPSPKELVILICLEPV